MAITTQLGSTGASRLNEICCWTWALDDGRETDSLCHLLSDDELAKAGAFRRACDRDAYVAAHAGLRVILGRHLNLHSSEIQFAASPGGKPYLVGRARYFFNLAHTRRLAICAIGNTAVGVDIEQQTDLVDFRGVLEQVATAAETAAFGKLEPAQQRAAFFRLWVRKEALLKAQGLGIAGEPARRHVGLEPWQGFAWNDLGLIEDGLNEHWLGMHLPAPPGHDAAVVVAADPEHPPARRDFSMPSAWSLQLLA